MGGVSDMNWKPMEAAPRDGTVFTVLCRSKSGIEVEVPNLKYAKEPMGQNFILWGTTNFLSPFLTPIGWRENNEH